MSDAGEVLRLRRAAADAGAEVERLCNNVAALLKDVGEYGKCSGCKKPIVYVRHANGKLTPYDPDGTDHRLTCWNAHQFRTGVRHDESTDG